MFCPMDGCGLFFLVRRLLYPADGFSKIKTPGRHRKYDRLSGVLRGQPFLSEERSGWPPRIFFSG